MFTSNGTFTAPSGGLSSVSYMLVGGGGGGAQGGGGGGGVLYGTTSLASGSYPVVIGAGGYAGMAGSGSLNMPGGAGGNTTFNGLVAIGGGSGGDQGGPNAAVARASGGPGGSGGGANNGNLVFGVGVAGQGYNGGTGYASGGPYGGHGGGGGASAIGANGCLNNNGSPGPCGGAGGMGRALAISGSNTYYAGGGGGGSTSQGGSGGGGNGTAPGIVGLNGTQNTGGGGGGSGTYAGNVLGGAGGAGVFFVSYPISTVMATATGSGGTSSTSGLYLANTFTASGTFTVAGGTMVANILVVAGGGGGGGSSSNGGGGGGGGGVQYFTNVALPAGSYAVTVGVGGAGGIGQTTLPTAGANSVFGGLSPSVGGGFGACNNLCSVCNMYGGSGGGAANTYAGGTSVVGQGNPGVGGLSGGGGGGAGGTGYGGNGGNGSSYSIGGTVAYYGGGGGGGNNGAPGAGGLGGGGAYGSVSGTAGTAGGANTGGGGGGGWNANGGSGGSGIVIIQYLAPPSPPRPPSPPPRPPPPADSSIGAVTLLVQADYGVVDRSEYAQAVYTSAGCASGPTLVQSAPAGGPGGATKAFLFNYSATYPTNPQCSIVTPSSLLNVLGSQPFTIEMWVYSSYTFGDIIGINQSITSVPGANAGWSWFVWSNSNTIPVGYCGSNNMNSAFTNPTTNATLAYRSQPNQWNHLAMVRYPSGTIITYAGGNVQGVSPCVSGSSIDANTASAIFIGGWNCGPGCGQPGFTGYMDQIRITTGVARYPYMGATSQAQFTPPAAAFAPYSAVIPSHAATTALYPPVALTGYSTTVSGQAYGNGLYTVSASSSQGSGAFNAFTTTTNANSGWNSANSGSSYHGGTGLYTGTVSAVIGGQSYPGDWLSISMPSAVYLGSYAIFPRSGTCGATPGNTESPAQWVLAGSNDCTTWAPIDSRSGVTYSSTTPGVNASFSVTPAAAYSCYMLSVQAIGASSAACGCASSTANCVPVVVVDLQLYASALAPNPPPSPPPPSPPPPISAGGALTSFGSTNVVTFTSSGTFTVSTPVVANVLVVAGGGGGGSSTVSGAGGGGAGGVQYFSGVALSAGSYSVTVGLGGSGGTSSGGFSGQNSVFGSLAAAIGGGYGGSNSPSQYVPAAGGSGGGGVNAGAGGAGTSRQGYAGTGGIYGGGGGGAGGTSSSGAGGPGVSISISGTVVYYGGGGGGGNNGAFGAGGLGGGGGYGAVSGTVGTAGTPNTGGGGGGGYNANGGAGGSGIVIISYTVAAQSYTASNLIGYWDFAVSSSYPGYGSAVADLSGANVLGTLNLNNTAAISTNVSSGYITFNNPAFNPANNVAITSAYTSGGWAGSTTTYTFEMLFSFSSMSAQINTGLMNWEGAAFPSGGGPYMFYQNLAAGSANQFVIGQYNFYKFPVTLASGTFYHIVQTINGTSSPGFYVNGALQTAQIISGSLSAPAANSILEIAALGNGYPFAGSMGMARVYNTSLTASQVTSNYVSAYNSRGSYSLPSPYTGVGYGGAVSAYNGYTVVTFTASGTFTVAGGSMIANILVVGGGGGGGSGWGGGGGGGGFLYMTNLMLTAGSYTVTVGLGGAGGYNSGTPVNATNGGNSVFATYIAYGGGGGASGQGISGGLSGGSGGGATNSNAFLGSGVAGQGYAGGTSLSGNGAGGGGAGAAGGAATNAAGGGVGGVGAQNSISGTAAYYAGGGGGANGGSWASGGLGGGGTAAMSGGAGTSNLGGGGGGAGLTSPMTGGAGGSGIVIVQYLTPTQAVDPYYSNVVLLLHGDGSAADSSPAPVAVTNTNVAYSNTLPQFGTGAFSFSGTSVNSSYLLTSSANKLSFGTSSFTIEFSVYLTTYGSYPLLLSNNVVSWSTGTNWAIYIWPSGVPYLQVIVNGGSTVSTSISNSTGTYSSATFTAGCVSTCSVAGAPCAAAAGALTLNSWNNVAFTRSGNIMYMYVNGLQVLNETLTWALDAGASNIIALGTSAVGYATAGIYLDEVRITMGIARYTGVVGSTYVPSTAAFYSTTSTTLLLHMDGPAGSTIVEDSSPTNAAMTAVGASLSTGAAALGYSSLAITTTNSASSGYVKTPTSALYTVGSAPFTIEFWFRLVATPIGNMCMFGNNAGSISVGGMGLLLTSSLLNFQMYNGAGGNPFSQLAYNASWVGSWTHFAFVRIGNVGTVYVNGNTAGVTYPGTNGSTLTGSLGDGSSNYLTFGNWPSNTAALCASENAYIDEVRAGFHRCTPRVCLKSPNKHRCGCQTARCTAATSLQPLWSLRQSSTQAAR